MKKGYVKESERPAGSLKKGYAKDVNIVNTPTVKIKHDSPMKENPTMHINSDELAAIKDWKIGSTYKLSVEVEMTGIHKRNEYGMIDEDEDSENEKGMSATFSIKNIKETGQ
jgi:hypothetical protein